MTDMQPIELRVYDTHKNIFSTSKKYVIPLYQRAYAWSDDEINQLIEDINGNQSENYYIGTLVVHRRNDDTFEVIDGQQRLTTLFLLLSFLNVPIRPNLSFDCRKRSNITLKYFTEKDSSRRLDETEIEDSLIAGKEIISEKFSNEQICVSDFKEKLSRVVLYRIEVPEKTDLNRYFEIMNTRGEQLEQHDVLKAKFMGPQFIDNSSIRDYFAKIWEACSDMTGYVQMNMVKVLREELFGKNWEGYPEAKSFLETKRENAKQVSKSLMSLEDILSSKKEAFSPEAMPTEGEKVRFEAPISFTYFLLHVLRVYVRRNNLKVDYPKLIEDINLLADYNKLFELKKDDKEFSLDFIDCLLKCRYLFDHYILKREYRDGDKDGEWSLKWLNKSNEEGAYYTDAYGKRKTDCLMLQAAMRVSFTSPKHMHWITKSLFWLFNIESWPKGPKESDYSKELAEMINSLVKENLFSQQNYKRLGTATPHLAFNYLDYLLWKEDPRKFDNFEFEYRTSVEHWFPQNPSEGTFAKWEPDEYNHFGNLCLIQRNVNSKFSNLEPHAKKSNFEDMISRGSLKLRMMAENTRGDIDWRNQYESFGEEMLKKLEDACGYTINTLEEHFNKE